ncbi:MAG: MBL fold metallo-hydrolase [Acidobacteria bacterium]|nr:MBL fold metallo-hydrolase [Acidobacteriota bacterium]
MAEWPIEDSDGSGSRESATSLRICSLGSGSRGNATFVASERTRLLVDAGFSFRELTKRLRAIGEEPEKLDGVLISHEHSDHIKGLQQIAKRLRCPIYITERTGQSIDWGAIEPRLETFEAGQTLRIADLDIDSFTIPHDAVDPVAFAVRCQGLKASLVTDLGYVTESVKYKIRGSDLLMLESNHDLDMLKVGPYPWFVKQRVMSRVGHLSNHAVSDFLEADLPPECRWLVLAHLSESNNHPEVARLFADTALRNSAAATQLIVAEQHRSTEVFEL